jgi:uncharacterized protein (TIGR00255 family)
MIRSMTGYGQGTAEAGGTRITVVVRSVNNRFVDLRIKLPAELADWEPELRRRCQAVVRRGRVELTVGLERAPEGEVKSALSRSQVEAALGAAAALRDEYGIEGSLELATLLSLPGVVQPPGRERPLGGEERAALERALDAALEAMDRERLREGEAMRVDILDRVERMALVVGHLEGHAAEIPERLRQKLAQRIAALAGGVEVDPSRLAQEVAFLADRGDYTEEIVRLEAHLEQVRALLVAQDDEPVGKRLDFLVQELHREANTVGSKSGDLDTSRSTLALKAEIEKIREQAQNLV